MGRYEIIEQDLGSQPVYHWTIYSDDGDEYSRSTYHTEKEACEAEAKERLEMVRSHGAI